MGFVTPSNFRTPVAHLEWEGIRGLIARLVLLHSD